ncbi:MAG: FAD-dependent oxidoreductase [Gemmataceae bacterium]|nr:FAD-dependent oxidoreductase [Gemmataceae bacterium]
MTHSRTILFALLLGTVVVIPQARPQEKEKGKPRSVDVVVYGATPAGIIAAITVAREGKSVVLLEPGKHLGGMITGGLCATDTGNRAGIGGYSREFFKRVRDYYVKKYGPKSEQVKDCSDGFRPEPHVAKLVFEEMLKEAKVKVVFGCGSLGLSVLASDPPRISGVITRHGEFNAQVYIDATYEGDLLATARVSYTVGREGRDKYNESLAGVQEHSKFHQFPVKVSPFAAGDKLLPLVQPGPAGRAGEGDRKVQAYNFRLCLTQRPDLRLPWPKPASYDPKRYELLARYLKARPDVKFGQLCNPVKLPNGKTDTNNNGPISTDHIGANWDYPKANDARRKAIFDDHVAYTQGFFYFLSTDPRVPKKLQAEVSSWGLSKGEHVDTNGWPQQLYIREARRMIGEYVMTQRDLMEERFKKDSVGLGSYNTDSHHVQRVQTKDGSVINEGDFQVRVQPYAIPYRCLVPKRKAISNLLVPVCVSSSHVAYGTIRMEPVYMILGQASGVAAMLAIDGKTSVQEVPVEKLQAKLKAQKAVLSPDEIKSASGVRGLDPAKLAGIVVDDTQATKTGAWVASTSAGPFVGEGYLHDGNEGQGTRRVRFTPKLPKAGQYEVRLFYSPHANRATNVKVVIRHVEAEAQTTVRVNQRLPLKEQGRGVRVGVFAFEAGERGWVEVQNDGADGFVIADAVQFVPVNGQKQGKGP